MSEAIKKKDSLEYGQGLAEKLRVWFHLSGLTPRGRWARWCRDPVGKVMKDGLLATGNWKNAPRGNPGKGYRVAAERRLSATGGGDS